MVVQVMVQVVEGVLCLKFLVVRQGKYTHIQYMIFNYISNKHLILKQKHIMNNNVQCR